MKKVLFISNIAGSEMKVGFCIGAITACDVLDLEFHCVANRSKSTPQQIAKDEEKYGVYLYHADIARSPFAISNIKAYKQIVDLIKNEGIDYIHCNTPVGGILGRLAGKKCKVKKVIYQVHGFHFYKGAPLKNRLIYKTIEKLMARYTDAIITINQEDFEAAKKFKLRNNGQAYFVHGVGIQLTEYEALIDSKEHVRKELGINDTDVIVISMGDLIPRKNYAVAIEAIAKSKISNLKYLICGQGPEYENLIGLTKRLGVESQVLFLGYRQDIKQLLAASDLFLFTTKQEGLSRSMMEAMASGLPCIASDIRGNTDLIDNGLGGFLCAPTDVDAFADAIDKIANNAELRQQMRVYNLEMIKQYDVSVVEREMTHIYKEVFLENK